MAPFQLGYNFMDWLFGQKAMVENAHAAGYKIGYEEGYEEGLKEGREIAKAKLRAREAVINTEPPTDYDRGVAEGIPIGIARASRWTSPRNAADSNRIAKSAGSRPNRHRSPGGFKTIRRVFAAPPPSTMPAAPHHPAG